MRLIFLVCLLVLACVGLNTVGARKTFIVSDLLEGAKKSSNEYDDDDANKCHYKKCQVSHYFSCSRKKKNTTSSDDKRVVPTGPNPLHNRESRAWSIGQKKKGVLVISEARPVQLMKKWH